VKHTRKNPPFLRHEFPPTDIANILHRRKLISYAVIHGLGSSASNFKTQNLTRYIASIFYQPPTGFANIMHCAKLISHVVIPDQIRLWKTSRFPDHEVPEVVI